VGNAARRAAICRISPLGLIHKDEIGRHAVIAIAFAQVQSGRS
jgi:hypothetical protein